MAIKKRTSIFEYGPEIQGTIPKRTLLDSSISEFGKVVRCGQYKGVELFILDMSSGAHTGTFKDWVACTTVAYCKHNKIEHFVTQSSGNTANAISAYCEHFSQPVSILYMLQNSKKLKPQFASSSSMVELIAVDGSESNLKTETRNLAERLRSPWLPLLEVQDIANSVRADLIIDYCAREDIWFDWHSQSLSSGYGVFGFYQGLERLGITKPIKFLGVQQSTVSPFIKRFAPEQFTDLSLEKEELIEPTLFRANPTENLFHRMACIIKRFGGEFKLVTNQIYNSYLHQALALLHQAGFDIVLDDSGAIVEKSGVIDLVGVLAAVDTGMISRGANVLASMTGGCGSPPIGELSPSKIIS